MKKLGSLAAQEPVYRPVYLQSLFLLAKEAGQRLGTYTKTLRHPNTVYEAKRPKHISRGYRCTAGSSQRGE